MNNGGRASLRYPDKRVARREIWLGRLAVLVTGAALLATSPPEQFSFNFAKSVALPEVELTESAPLAELLVTARALGLAPNGKPTTNADAVVAGVLAQLGAAKFVKARIVNGDGSVGNELTVLTDFRLAAALAFSGDCEAPGQGVPCEASFVIELEREDAGTLGGSVVVSGSVELQASTPKAQGPSEGPLDLPWSVEITRR